MESNFWRELIASLKALIIFFLLFHFRNTFTSYTFKSHSYSGKIIHRQRQVTKILLIRQDELHCNSSNSCLNYASLCKQESNEGRRWGEKFNPAIWLKECTFLKRKDRMISKAFAMRWTHEQLIVCCALMDISKSYILRCILRLKMLGCAFLDQMESQLWPALF